MLSLVCNLIRLGSRATRRRAGIGRALCLCWLALIVISSGCRRDSAQWKVAAAVNEEKNANPEGAIELLQKALQMDPESSHIKLHLARLLAENDQGDLGLTLCDEILESDPNDKNAWQMRSVCLRFLGRFDESLAAYQKAIFDIIDKGPDELNELAYLRALAGVQLDKALRQINLGIGKYERQFVPIRHQKFSLFASQSLSWGSYSQVPVEISTLVTAGLLSRHTDEGHLLLMDLLNTKIQEEQLLWLARNKRLDLLVEAHDESSDKVSDLKAKRQQAIIEAASNKVELVTGNLVVLLATRSLIFEDQGQTRLADLDRLWLKKIGFRPQEIYGSLPNDNESMLLLKDGPPFLDTRGFVLTQMPWQPTWTDPSGKVIRIQGNTSLASYGSYHLALEDLDLAIAASEIRLLVFDSDAVNRIERSVGSIRELKERETRIVAVLRNHRRQAHIRAKQFEAAKLDQLRIEELGLKADSNLF